MRLIRKLIQVSFQFFATIQIIFHQQATDGYVTILRKGGLCPTYYTIRTNEHGARRAHLKSWLVQPSMSGRQTTKGTTSSSAAASLLERLRWQGAGVPLRPAGEHRQEPPGNDGSPSSRSCMNVRSFNREDVFESIKKSASKPVASGSLQRLSRQIR
jgi:hypothetical protein